MDGMVRFATIFILSFFGVLSSGLAAPKASYASGYTADVQSERSESYVEIFLFLTPPPPSEDLNAVIFNRPLSKEFKEKYREKFGTLDTESIVYQESRFKTANEEREAQVRSIEQEGDRRAYGEFMVKRLSEWHMDNYFKSEPSMRPIYEVKEKISNVKVEVAKEVKLNLQYSFSGNSLDVVLDNPWCDSKMIVDMDPHAFGPGPVQENRLFLSRKVGSQARINSQFYTVDGISKLEWVQMLGPYWTSSYGASTPFKDSGITPRESRVSVGFGRAF